MKITSEWVGKLKERRVFTLTLIRKPQIIDGEWGISYLHKFEDEDGNYFAAFAKEPLSFNDKLISLGEKVLVKGTITKHNLFYKTKETVLSRIQCVGLWKDVYENTAFDEFLRDQGYDV